MKAEATTTYLTRQKDKNKMLNFIQKYSLLFIKGANFKYPVRPKFGDLNKHDDNRKKPDKFCSCKPPFHVIILIYHTGAELVRTAFK